jgi:hypothetical protein
MRAASLALEKPSLRRLFLAWRGMGAVSARFGRRWWREEAINFTGGA